MTRPVNHAAVRAYGRASCAAFTQLAQDEHRDAAFDGGEWSGPAYARAYDRMHAHYLSVVAPRFGLTPDELEHDLAVTLNDPRGWPGYPKETA